MANPIHLQILQSGLENWNKWRDSQPSNFIPDLSNANLEGINLKPSKYVNGENFSDLFNIEHANDEEIFYLINLENANLIEVNFKNAIFLETNFKGTNLKKEDFKQEHHANIIFK